MIIDSSAVQMSSMRQYVEINAKTESMKVWVGNAPEQGQPATNSNDWVTLSPGAKQYLSPQSAPPDPANSDPLDSDPKWLLIKAMIEHLTGKKVHLLSVSNTNGSGNKPAQNTGSSQAPPPTQKDGWGAIYEKSSLHYESENTSFSAGGTVKTQDGREISFSLNLDMSREYETTSSTSIRVGDAAKVDPLVVSYGGSAAQLSSSTFAFDLNTDGKNETISSVGPGSGFLSLDINGDGKINNGSELFGPTSGNGFSELAKYDKDGNGWIDEKDPVYSKLSVWTMDPSSGNSSLNSLAGAGVGAIYLGHAATGFDLRDPSTNALNGQVKDTGVYLAENGTAGTIQQVDLTAQETASTPVTA